MALHYLKFRDINLNDPFFDSLKQDYPLFERWYISKSEAEAYVSYNDNGCIDGFLYLKNETEELSDMTPALMTMDRVKCGTFKIDAHGTKLGERFVRKIFDYALSQNKSLIYVTIFDKHQGLINLLTRYGFRLLARKNEITPNGQEGVYFKDFVWRD